jgi:pSer/pThr/pTyr-binding forkhead associated (FHA) protein
MQLTFPNGEHPNVAFNYGEISVGSKAGLSISLSGRNLAPHHASLVADRRGLWMRVPSGTPGVHLNARPVKRLAMLRVGDQIVLEQVQIVISEDNPQVIERNIPMAAPPVLADAQKVSAARVVLRGVSGAHHGRSITLNEPRVIGKGAGCDIRIDDVGIADRHVQLELQGDRVILRALAPNANAMVNGVPVRDAVLAPGDQVVIDSHRFVLEAPGLPPRGQEAAVRSGVVAHTQTIKAVKVPANSEGGGGAGAKPIEDMPSASSVDPGALWWLIAAAAVLAAALTALLVYSPRIGG